MHPGGQESRPSLTTGTFTIVASDGRHWGVAVASRVLAVGAIVPNAGANVGAVATQATVNVAWKSEAMALLERGMSATDVVSALVTADPEPGGRQVAVVDGSRGVAAYTGPTCTEWAGHRVGDGYAVAGNILAGPGVLQEMEAAYVAAAGSMAERCLAALAAADEAGGDRRGRQSAALLVVRQQAGIEGRDDRLCDLRVDDHAQPIQELARLLAVAALDRA